MRSSSIVAAAAATVMALIVLPTALVPLGPVDDHEIVRIARGDLLPILEEHRFRPLYWILRHAEAWIWGTNPAGWAFDRAVLGVVTVLLGYAIARRFVAPLPAVLAGLLIVAGPQAEAFYRFGPQESYGMPLLLGAVLGVLSGRPAFLALAVAAAFTKETFALAAVPVLALAWWQVYRRETLIAAVFVLVAAVGVTLAAMHGGAATGGSRLLLPWLLLPIAVAVWLAQKRPRVVGAAMAVLVALGVVGGVDSALRWAAVNVAWQQELTALRTAGEPLIVRAGPEDYERALSLLVWLPGTRAMLVVDEPCPGSLCDRLRRVSREGGYGYEPLTAATRPPSLLAAGHCHPRHRECGSSVLRP